MADEIEEEALRLLTLADVDMLITLTEEFRIEVPDNKRGKKQHLLQLLFMYLGSDDVVGRDDGGGSVFGKLVTDLEVYGLPIEPPQDENGVRPEADNDPLPVVVSNPPLVTTHITPPDVKPVIKHSSVSRSSSLPVVVSSAGTPVMSTKTSFEKLREFKINGTIGSTSKNDNISFTSLLYQMEKGRKSGRSDEEIQLAVIRAMKPGMSLRVYLESKGDFDHEAFLKILRSHFNERDATTVFQEMCNCTQKASESALDFCLRVMGLREKVSALAREEAGSLDMVTISKRFFHTVFTGLKSSTLRLELKKILSEASVTDEQLLEEISLVTTIEQEHLKKFSTGSNVNAVAGKVQNEDQMSSASSQSAVLSEIKKLSAKVNEINSFRTDLDELRAKLDGALKVKSDLNPSTEPFKSRRRSYKCSDCEKNKVNRCVHCFFCKSPDHKIDACPTKNC